MNEPQVPNVRKPWNNGHTHKRTHKLNRLPSARCSWASRLFPPVPPGTTVSPCLALASSSRFSCSDDISLFWDSSLTNLKTDLFLITLMIDTTAVKSQGEKNVLYIKYTKAKVRKRGRRRVSVYTWQKSSSWAILEWHADAWVSLKNLFTAIKMTRVLVLH